VVVEEEGRGAPAGREMDGRYRHRETTIPSWGNWPRYLCIYIVEDKRQKVLFYPLNLFWKLFFTYIFLVLDPHISGSGPQLKFLCIGSSYFIVIWSI
jgi:hypothetical protein